MNIVLIGYRGTGKSAVGRILAERLGWPLFSFDKAIVKMAGKSIPEIVQEKGWEHFRDLETEITLEYSRKDRCIFDTGGGCILRPQNVEALKRNGRLYWLKASVETIASRICGDDQRPSLTGGKSFVDEIAEVLAQREEKYRAASDEAIDTDGLSVEQVAERILSSMGRAVVSPPPIEGED